MKQMKQGDTSSTALQAETSTEDPTTTTSADRPKQKPRPKQTGTPTKSSKAKLLVDRPVTPVAVSPDKHKLSSTVNGSDSTATKKRITSPNVLTGADGAES
jgi:hypothetical protein